MSQPSETPPRQRRPWTQPRLTKVGTIADVAGGPTPLTQAVNTRS
jgi:hypothetical protein